VSVHTIILDASPINSIDTAGISCLVSISEVLKKRNVRFLLANVRGPVRDMFSRARFYDTVKKKASVCVSVCVCVCVCV
jgi:anti-anti-sigma regulatory factor